MIVETIVTTRDATGLVNVAPMGVEWEPASDDSRTRSVRRKLHDGEDALKRRIGAEIA